MIVCCGHLLLVSPGYYSLKCTGDTNFGVRIRTNLGHQIWCPGDTIIFYSAWLQNLQLAVIAVSLLIYCSCL